MALMATLHLEAEPIAQPDADALITINKTDARQRVLDFFDPLLDSNFRIFVFGKRLGIAEMDDLRGLTVGVERAGSPQVALRSDPRIRSTVIPTILDGFKMLKERRLDAVVVDEWVGRYIVFVLVFAALVAAFFAALALIPARRLSAEGRYRQETTDKSMTIDEKESALKEVRYL